MLNFDFENTARVPVRGSSAQSSDSRILKWFLLLGCKGMVGGGGEGDQPQPCVCLTRGFGAQRSHIGGSQRRPVRCSTPLLLKVKAPHLPRGTRKPLRPRPRVTHQKLHWVRIPRHLCATDTAHPGPSPKHFQLLVPLSTSGSSYSFKDKESEAGGGDRHGLRQRQEQRKPWSCQSAPFHPVTIQLPLLPSSLLTPQLNPQTTLSRQFPGLSPRIQPCAKR